MLAGAMLLGASSCNSDSDEPTEIAMFNDFATYTSSGTGSTFTLRKEGDSPLVTLTTSQNLPENQFKDGTRLFISYTPATGQQYMSGPITLIGAMNVEGSGSTPEEKTAAETSDWLSDAINVASLMRTGDYINVQFTGALGSQTAVVHLYADAATIYDEIPEYHLIYGPYSGIATTTYVFYGSWNIGNVWNRSTCKGIKVMYRNAGGAMGGSVTITKPNTGFVKPDPIE